MQTALPAPEAVRTEGSHIYLADGRCLIDGIASWWTACHGYNHPALLMALKEQADRMPHIMLGGVVHEPATTLATRLAACLPGDLQHIFFVDSGSVAVEVALKIALQYWHNLGAPLKKRFIYFENSYHGDTLGAMSVSDSALHVAFNDHQRSQQCCRLPQTPDEWATLEDVLYKNHTELAGLIIEPLVQGAGGMIFHPASALTRLRALCDTYGILMIVDEIFTGFGRTGTLFASEQAEIVPDILCLGKGLTGGVMGLAATAVRPFVYQAFLSDSSDQAFMHGPTYMGNPLACAVANASLTLFETEPRLEQVNRIYKQMSAQLEQNRVFSCVKDVRCLGAIGVVELYPDTPFDLQKARHWFLDQGVFIRPLNKVLYLTPAFTVPSDELSQLTEAIGHLTYTL